MAKEPKKSILKKLSVTFLTVFLPMFMILIFGPAEIFFANATEFKFVYGDFAGYLIVMAIGIALMAAVILSFVPDWLRQAVMSVVFGISLAGYLQIMFLNRNLDLLGERPEGYQIQKTSAVVNLIVWLALIGVIVFLAYWKQDVWKKVVFYGSGFLLCIQTVAWVSLILTADEKAFVHMGEYYHFTGEEQYTVSADKNIIVVILDYFSNEDLKKTLEVYPDMEGFLNDFTFYSNVDCNYYGTYPSIPHFLSGQEVDMSLPVNDWFYNIWNNEETQSFYDMLHENNYKTNVYTPDTHHLCGTNDPVIMAEEFTNIVDSARNIDVFYKLLFKTITKMSCYRMGPELLKPCFYTRGDEYGDIIAYTNDPIDHNNYDFYKSLLERGLETDSSHNYFIVQHLLGPHERTTGPDGFYKEGPTWEETIKGCMVIMEEYMNQLKEIGVYENATIIITSDHGDVIDSQVTFYIKESGERHDIMQSTNAPISLAELRATVAEAVGVDYSRWGQSIHDFAEDEMRKRTVWVRGGIEGYPFVPHYAEDRDGNANVWQAFTYVGDMSDLYQKIEEGPDIIVPMVNSFY